MVEFTLDKQAGILHVKPRGPLRQEDFAELTRVADAYIEQAGGLSGLIIETERFPGWENLAAALAHLRFVKDHHEKIRKVALVTDSPLGDVAERLASHFVSAQIRQFDAGELEAARQWVGQSG